MKNLSVDEILDDLKQKKSGTQANSPATSVDVDRLITEIIEEKKKTGPSDKEPDIPTVTIPAPPQPLSKPQTENCRSSAARFRMVRRVSRIRRAI